LALSVADLTTLFRRSADLEVAATLDRTDGPVSLGTPATCKVA
jgi:hypothetical protein